MKHYNCKADSNNSSTTITIILNIFDHDGTNIFNSSITNETHMYYVCVFCVVHYALLVVTSDILPVYVCMWLFAGARTSSHR